MVLKLQLRDVSTRRQHFLIPYSSYRWKGRLRENRVERARRNTRRFVSLSFIPLTLYSPEEHHHLSNLPTEGAVYQVGNCEKRRLELGTSTADVKPRKLFKALPFQRVHHPSSVLHLGRVNWIWILWFHQEGDQGLHVQEGIHFLAHPLQVS